jgi:L-lactate utilization protein LutB
MNSKTEITIQVPLEIARYYAKIQPNDRGNIENKLTETIQLELEKYRQKAAARLSTIMDQASDEAEANGFTPDILASILEPIES